jgi:hypothetical protein
VLAVRIEPVSFTVGITTAGDLTPGFFDQLFQAGLVRSSAASNLIQDEFQPIVKELVTLQWPERLYGLCESVECLEAAA